MSSFVSKWVVLRRHAVGADDLDADGLVRDDVVVRWIDEARDEYLACCPVLHERGQREGWVVRAELGELPRGAELGSPETVNVSAGATEVWPTSFTIAFRLRSFGSSGDVAFNVACAVSAVDPATGEARELGEAVRDELIALAHGARYFN